MGLAEQRLIERLATQVIPQHEQELLAIVGGPVGYVIDWTYFVENAAAVEGLERWGFATVAEAFRRVAADAVGRAALAGAVQTIRLSQWAAVWPSAALADGNLDLTWDWGGPERLTPAQLEAFLVDRL